VQIPPHHDPSCFGCGDNPIGLHLPRPAAAGLTEYEAYVTFDGRHQGGPGIVHGGIVSATLDEAAGLLATWHSFPTVTARLFVRYRRPVPINTELLVAARLVDLHGRRLHVDARVTDGGEPLAEARVALLHVPLEHFLATPEGRAAAGRWSAQDLADAADAGGEQAGGA
jgi:acyl-coenzyme A thioesterase PaaI-like protein